MCARVCKEWATSRQLGVIPARILNNRRQLVQKPECREIFYKDRLYSIYQPTACFNYLLNLILQMLIINCVPFSFPWCSLCGQRFRILPNILRCVLLPKIRGMYTIMHAFVGSYDLTKQACLHWSKMEFNPWALLAF